MEAIGDKGVTVLSWQVVEVEDEVRANRADPCKVLGVERENLLYASDVWDSGQMDMYKSYSTDSVWDADAFPWLSESDAYDWTVTDTTIN